MLMVANHTKKMNTCNVAKKLMVSEANTSRRRQQKYSWLLWI